MTRLRKRFLDCSGLTMQQCEALATDLAKQQRDLMFFIGDMQRYAEHKWPETHHQIWPEWTSNGLLARAAGVARAYPKESDREFEATFTQYMQVSGKQDRFERLADIADKGQTTDESRTAMKSERNRWLLAIDVNYFLHRWWHSGAGVEAAMGVAGWIQRTAARLKEAHNLTDVACCFDDRTNHRKELTKDWEDKYKPRPPKDAELVHQLQLVRQLLEGHGFACASIEGMEGDDLMASFAKQFDGKITLLTQDKDCRQCLSEKCNILLDVEWTEDETSGEMLPEYKWMSAKKHTELTGIPPNQWTEFQTLMGDNVDGIKGCIGIGEKGAADLVKEFGSAAGAIAAAKAEHESIKPKRREALIEFESKLDVTRRLVTLVDDLTIPTTTRI